MAFFWLYELKDVVSEKLHWLKNAIFGHPSDGDTHHKNFDSRSKTHEHIEKSPGKEPKVEGKIREHVHGPKSY